MTNSEKRPIIVNGAGPVGLTMACEMARHGVDFRIFDKNTEAATQSRALAIFPRTLEVFSTIGVLDQALAEGQRITALSLYSDERLLARMSFENIDSPFRFALALPQYRTERILEARLNTLGRVVERDMELIAIDDDTGGVRARYHRAVAAEEIVEGSWLLGCDGAHSAARRLIGVSFQGAQYDEEFLLADVKVESDLPTDEAHLFFAKEGVFAYFPFRGGRGRIIADQRPGATHAGTEPTMDELREIVRRRCSHPMQISDPVWKAWFQISHRMVERYGKGRIFLAGDAAHIHSPAGGQGMNTGIQDASTLRGSLHLCAGEPGARAPCLTATAWSAAPSVSKCLRPPVA